MSVAGVEEANTAISHCLRAHPLLCESQKVAFSIKSKV